MAFGGFIVAEIVVEIVAIFCGNPAEAERAPLCKIPAIIATLGTLPLLDDPTRGVDVAAKAGMYRLRVAPEKLL